MLKKRLMFLAILVICFFTGMKAYAAENVNYRIEVKELSQNQVQMDLILTNCEAVYGSQIYVDFDPKVYEAKEILKGNLLIEGDATVKLISKKIDNTKGKITYCITKVGQQGENQNEGTLFSVIFDKKGVSNNAFVLSSKSILSDINGNVVPFAEVTEKDLTIECLTSAKEYKVNETANMVVRATNKTAVEKDVTLIVALYNESGKMVNYVALKHVVKAGENVELEGEIKLIASGRVCCFVWDSIDNMFPLSERLEYKVNP